MSYHAERRSRQICSLEKVVCWNKSSISGPHLIAVFELVPVHVQLALKAISPALMYKLV